MISKISKCELCNSEVVCEEVLDDFFVCFKCQKDSFRESIPEKRKPYSKDQIHNLMKVRQKTHGIVEINNNVLEVKLEGDDVVLTGIVWEPELTTIAGDRTDYEEYMWFENESDPEPFAKILKEQKHIFYDDLDDYNYYHFHY